MIRVLIAEDQGLVLGALAALLELEDDISVVAQCADGQAALEQTLEIMPDIVLTDIEMPRMTGLELALKLKKRGLPAKVVIVTTFARAGFLRRALEAGISGYLLKDTKAADLAEAVRRVHAGGRAIDPNLAIDAWSEADPLTDRERQVLCLAGLGVSSLEIAGQLRLSEGTVRNYLFEAISKLGASNRVDASRVARDKGWL